jgi:hypothetical protein
VWRRGSPFHVLLHATAPPTRQHALVLELDRLGPPPPPPLRRPDLGPAPYRAPPLLGARLAEPAPRVSPRYERALAPPTTSWVAEHSHLEQWQVQPPPGTYRGWLRLRPLDAGEAVALTAPVGIGLIDAR